MYPSPVHQIPILSVDYLLPFSDRSHPWDMNLYTEIIQIVHYDSEFPLSVCIIYLPKCCLTEFHPNWGTLIPCSQCSMGCVTLSVHYMLPFSDRSHPWDMNLYTEIIQIGHYLFRLFTLCVYYLPSKVLPYQILSKVGDIDFYSNVHNILRVKFSKKIECLRFELKLEE